MTALALPRSRSNPAPFLFLVFVIIAFIMALASAHAVMTHGSAAIDAQHCFNGEGQIMQQIYMNPLTGRTMEFCNQHGHWFIKIDGPDGGNVTMFPRSFARCISDVIDYAKRTGFTKLLPMLH